MKEFDARFGINLLTKMVSPPPSDDMLDGSIVKRIQNFLATSPSDPVIIWNFYMEIRDLVVHGALGTDFIVTVLSLDEFCSAPAGAYNHADGSLAQAPWRQGDRT